jgi:hypothetical protein
MAGLNTHIEIDNAQVITALNGILEASQRRLRPVFVEIGEQLTRSHEQRLLIKLILEAGPGCLSTQNTRLEQRNIGTSS